MIIKKNLIDCILIKINIIILKKQCCFDYTNHKKISQYILYSFIKYTKNYVYYM